MHLTNSVSLLGALTGSTIVTAVALQATAIWADRRYLDMSLLKSREVTAAKAA